MQDRTDYNSLINNESVECYSEQSVITTSEEYVQGIVLNKEFYKLYANILQLKNNIKGRWVGEYDGFSVLQNKNHEYLTNEEINKLDIDVNYNIFINDNELVQTGVINRILKILYTLQEGLLDLTAANISNLKTVVSNDNILRIN